MSFKERMIPAWFRTRKAAQVTAFFALKSGGSIKILKATKLVYLADRLSLQRRDFPITNDKYVSLEFGPVNSHTYNCMNGNISQTAADWSDFVLPRTGHDLFVKPGVDFTELDELSTGDVKILNDTWQQFEDLGGFDLAEWTHTYCPEWKDPGKSSAPIELVSILSALNKPEPDALANDILAERNFNQRKG